MAKTGGERAQMHVPAGGKPHGKDHHQEQPVLANISERARSQAGISTDTTIPDILRSLGLDAQFNESFAALKAKEAAITAALKDSTAVTDADRLDLLKTLSAAKGNPQPELLSRLDKGLGPRAKELAKRRHELEAMLNELPHLIEKFSKRGFSVIREHRCGVCGAMHLEELFTSMSQRGAVSAKSLERSLEQTRARLEILDRKDPNRRSLSIYENLLDAIARNGREVSLFVIQPEGTCMLYISMPHSGGFISTLVADRVELALPGINMEPLETERSLTFLTSSFDPERLKKMLSINPDDMREKNGSRKMADLVAYVLGNAVDEVSAMAGLRFHIKAIS